MHFFFSRDCTIPVLGRHTCFGPADRCLVSSQPLLCMSGAQKPTPPTPSRTASWALPFIHPTYLLITTLPSPSTPTLRLHLNAFTFTFTVFAPVLPPCVAASAHSHHHPPVSFLHCPHICSPCITIRRRQNYPLMHAPKTNAHGVLD